MRDFIPEGEEGGEPTGEGGYKDFVPAPEPKKVKPKPKKEAVATVKPVVKKRSISRRK